MPRFSLYRKMRRREPEQLPRAADGVAVLAGHSWDSSRESMIVGWRDPYGNKLCGEKDAAIRDRRGLFFQDYNEECKNQIDGYELNVNGTVQVLSSAQAPLLKAWIERDNLNVVLVSYGVDSDEETLGVGPTSLHEIRLRDSDPVRGPLVLKGQSEFQLRGPDGQLPGVAVVDTDVESVRVVSGRVWLFCRGDASIVGASVKFRWNQGIWNPQG